MTMDEVAGHVGARVTYRDYLDGHAEKGTITGLSATYAFVRYDGDASSKATDPGRLTLLGGAQ